MSTKGNVILSKLGEKCMEEELKALHVFPSTDKEKKVKKVSIWSQITLEPMWVGVTISFTMSLIAHKNLFLQRACMVDLGYSEEMCLRSEGAIKSDLEVQSQKIVSSLSITSGFVKGFVTIVTLLFLGPWSDSSGRRKPLIILPLIGSMCASLGLLTMQAFPNVSTIWMVYIELIPTALTGNFALLLISAFSHLGDICYKTGRCTTTVMGSNLGMVTVSTVIGSLLTPIIYRTSGFVGMFSVSMALDSTSIIYSILKIQDVNLVEKIPSIFDYTLPYQALKCVFKKREGTRRKNVLLMITVACSHSVNMIELPITYMYLRNQFDWTEVEFMTLIAYRNILQSIGVVLMVKVLKQKLKFRDEVIGIFGSLSQLATAASFMFSYKTWMIFSLAIVGLLKSGVMVAERPVLNRQIIASEQGKINAIIAVLEKFTAFLLIPLANYIYHMTLDWLPTSFLIISIVSSMVQIICYIMVDKEPTEVELKDQGSKA